MFLIMLILLAIVVSIIAYVINTKTNNKYEKFIIYGWVFIISVLASAFCHLINIKFIYIVVILDFLQSLIITHFPEKNQKNVLSLIKFINIIALFDFFIFELIKNQWIIFNSIMIVIVAIVAVFVFTNDKKYSFKV